MTENLSITINVPVSLVGVEANALVIRLYESTKVFDPHPTKEKTAFYILEDQYDLTPIDYINSSMVYKIPDDIKQKNIENEVKCQLKNAFDKMYKNLQKTPSFSNISREDFIKMLTED